MVLQKVRTDPDLAVAIGVPNVQNQVNHFIVPLLPRHPMRSSGTVGKPILGQAPDPPLKGGTGDPTAACSLADRTKLLVNLNPVFSGFLLLFLLFHNDIGKRIAVGLWSTLNDLLITYTSG
jgi:hypothetical protein